MEGFSEIECLLYTLVVTGVMLWKNMDLFIFGMTRNTNDIISDAGGEKKMMDTFALLLG
jgi:hypothetical protein